MTLQDIYDLSLDLGMKADPRGIANVKKILLKRKKEYEELSEEKKKYFDRENLTNPYTDSRILFGDPKTKIKKVMAGIDADASEVLLMDRLNQKGRNIDLLISHHPSGHALASLHEVMDIHVEAFSQVGVPENVAYSIMNEGMGFIKRRISPRNHNQTVDAARLLEVPLLALHTIWDNLGDHFMKEYIAKKKVETVGELLEYVSELPEFVESTKGKSGPALVAGSEKSPTGKIMINFTGGTNPPKELSMELSKAGVGTIIDMHVPEETIAELKKAHINVIDSGHMASDSIGANIFLDQLEKRGVEVIPCSGLIRVRRTK